MLVKENEPLARYTTFRIGGFAPKMYIPESESELITTVKDLHRQQQQYYLLGNGSNVLIRDRTLSRPVILNTKSCDYLNFKDNGTVEVGASVDLRKLIKKLIEHNLASPVALYTVPGTLGGAIFQNASRNSFKVSITDNLQTIRYFDGEKIATRSKQEGEFRWRYSVFHQHPDWLILSATFKFAPQSKEEGDRELAKSIEAAAKKSYRQNFSVGSVFKTKHLPLMKRFAGLRWGDAEYSATTLNTIHNLGQAKFSDVTQLIFLAKLLHWLCFKKIELEIDIWR